MNCLTKEYYRLLHLKKDRFTAFCARDVDGFSKLNEIFRNYELCIDIGGGVLCEKTIPEEIGFENALEAIKDAKEKLNY